MQPRRGTGATWLSSPPPQRGLFATNVPYPLPVAAFGGELYLVLGGNGDGGESGGAGGGDGGQSGDRVGGQSGDRVVLFRPHEWRGGEGDGGNRSAARLAHEIGRQRRGSVGHVYVTSDGGADLDLIYDLVQLLPPHVELVDDQTLVELALQRDKHLRR